MIFRRFNLQVIPRKSHAVIGKDIDVARNNDQKRQHKSPDNLE